MMRHVHNVLAVAEFILEKGLFPLATGTGVAVLIAGRGDLLVALVALMALGLAVEVLVMTAAKASERSLDERVGGGR